MGAAGKSRPPVLSATFACEGDYWMLSFQNRTVRLKDSKGLRQIATLLRDPGREFHVFDLAALAEAGTRAVGISQIDPRTVSELPLRSAPDADAGELIDSKARAAYRQRIIELREGLDDARARELRDEERIAQLEDEIDLITRELTTSFGLGGRSRKAAAAADRVRMNVSKNISRAIGQINASHDGLARLLRSTIKTGIFCSYIPNPDFPIDWSFEVETRTEYLTQPVTAEPQVNSAALLLRDLAHRRPLVGREAEQRELRRLFEKVAKSGRGALALIAGSPGVGKTRLIAELATEAAAAELLIGHCYEGEGVAYQPFVEILENITGRAGDIQTLRSLLGEDAVEIARLLPNLRRTLTDLPPPLEVGPEQARRLMFQALCRVLTRGLGSRPGLMILEDLHWADESTLSMLLHLVHQLPELRVLLIGSYRDSALDVHPALAKILEDLTRNRSAAELSLKGLTRDGTGQMVMNLSARTPPRRLIETIFKETDGNPFFVEELLRFLEQENRLYDAQGEFRPDIEIGENDAPQSVRLVVGRRLERLTDDTRKILATAAVIGRLFSLKVLAASASEEIDAALDCAEEAQAGGFLSSGAGGTYEFRHELVRQAVLSRLSNPRLERLHLAVANTIERLHPDSLDNHAPEIAPHLRRAGTIADPEQTIKYLTVAAERAFQQGVLKEAEDAYRDALGLLLRLPESAVRDARELELLLSSEETIRYARGVGSPEVDAIIRRADELCERVGTDAQRFSILVGMRDVLVSIGDYESAIEKLRLALDLAERAHDTEMLQTAAAFSGITLYMAGKLDEALLQSRRALELTRLIQGKRSLPSLRAEWIARSMVANSLLLLGFPDQAQRAAGEALANSRQVTLPTASLATQGIMFVYLNLGMGKVARGFAEEGLAAAERSEFGFVRAMWQGRLGCAIAQEGNPEQGLAMIREALSELNAATQPQSSIRPKQFFGDRLGGRSPVVMSMVMLSLIEALSLSGRFDEVIEECDAFCQQSTLPRTFLANAYLLKGQAVLGRDPFATDQAQTCFRKAIEIAQGQSAKWWELRATVSLARLLRDTDRRDEARTILSEIYNWFVEGFHTPDLKDARALLDELRNSP
jgi:tetratricopeptide (TPR) repeat protein